MASPANSIPDTALGLSRDEVILLRQHQHVALSQHGGSNRASNASSQGRLLLDPGSLQALAYHFDRLMGAIQQRMHLLNQQTQISTAAAAGHAADAMAHADREIARFHEIMRQLDELEREFDKVRHIRDIVKGFRGRVESLERRF
ncbi:MAG: hypothetical protein M1832_002492 [Thelocarpon impressellum]|nr:MAG: hypothetical protein M1832_002492 [Thelocarpon impressellum]